MEKYAKYLKLSALPEENRKQYSQRLYVFLAKADMYYPNFAGWFNNLFDDNLQLKPDREIFFVCKDDKIAGVAIAKSTKEESKICTLYVAKEHQRCGIGKRLMQLSLFWIGEDRTVIITLDSSKESEFTGILRHFGFVLDGEKEDMYTHGKTELMYARKPS